MQKSLANAEYQAFIKDLKKRILSARISAFRAVNRDLILLYWDIGRGLVEKQRLQQWGDGVVDTVSRDLQKAFPGARGFSSRNLRDMKRFFLAYSSPEFWRQAVAKMKPAVSGRAGSPIWRQVVAKLKKGGGEEFVLFLRQLAAEVPWGQHLTLLNKTADPVQRFYYMLATARFGWSRIVLLNQIKARTYERLLKERKMHNFPAALPEALAEQAETASKSSYSLEFLGIDRISQERELEGMLIEKLKDFILELGYGFCFVGRQYRLTLGHKEYFIDLLFYHRFLKSLVAIELKAGSFEPEHAGKMDFYLNLLNEKERSLGDRPSIGIILCAEKDNLEVEFALKSKVNPIGVAEYHLRTQLPPALKGKFPTASQLARAMKKRLHLRGQ
ncbi:MAG: DUF1016 domain-containing protein [Candidatus Omnitrophica bacterium]|nr:DUF1016 domain-containing protein [Candidatus Omnitrophota bacterium]